MDPSRQQAAQQHVQRLRDTRVPAEADLSLAFLSKQFQRDVARPGANAPPDDRVNRGRCNWRGGGMPPILGVMDNPERLAYLVLLGLAIGGSLVIANRHNVGRIMRQAGIWTLIFLGAISAAWLWEDSQGGIAPRQTYMETGAVSVPRAYDGHFYLTAAVNGVDVDFVVDTGATDMVLTRQDAARVGLDPDDLAYLGSASTANGRVPIAAVVLEEFDLGEIRDRNVRASVNGGEMRRSLLGMSYLARFERIEIKGDRLVLER